MEEIYWRHLTYIGHKQRRYRILHWKSQCLPPYNQVYWWSIRNRNYILGHIGVQGRTIRERKNPRWGYIFEAYWEISVHTLQQLSPRGGGGVPMMPYTGRLRPKVKEYLFQASGIKRVEISLVEVLKGRKICHLGLWKGTKRSKSWILLFLIIKSRKRSIFVIDSYLRDSAFIAVKKDAKF